MAVEMRVDPQQPQRRPDDTGDTTPGADGYGVIATDDHGELRRAR